MSQPSKIPVCITVAPEQLARLDQAAADLDRSRSWVTGRAIEEFLSRSSPLGEAAMPVLPGPPTTAGRGLGAPPGSTFPQKRSSRMSDLNQDVLARQAELARQRASLEQSQLADVAKRNAEYLERLDNGEDPQ